MDRERRLHPRVTGPFEGTRLGILDTPVQIYDLSVGGCFINATHEPSSSGVRFELAIDLGDEGTLTIQCDTLYPRPGFGYAVRFLDLTDEARAKLERALAPLIQSQG